MAGLRAAGTGGAALLVVIITLAALAPALVGAGSCPSATQSAPTEAAERGIPARYLTLYRQAGERYRVPWQLLAGIGAIESDHGRSPAPGVRSGVNAYGCCAGPMQFNLRDGPPSTWQRYGEDGNGDGTTDVHEPADAIASAANYLRALLHNTGGDIGRAILGYNHSQAYVDDVLARAHAYAGAHDAALVEPGTASPVLAACASGRLEGLTGPVDLRAARRLTAPRAYRELPPWTLATSGSSVTVDARIYDNVI
jgi:hypothetical protein